MENRSDRIYRLAAKDKFISFENYLCVAKPEHYAMLHGQGGKEFAPHSVIKLRGTDYSNRSNAISVDANIGPEVPGIWAEVALRNMTETKIVLPRKSASGFWWPMVAAEKTYRAFAAMIAACGTGINAVYKGKDTKTVLAEVGKVLGPAKTELSVPTDGSVSDEYVTIPKSEDYQFATVKVSPYRVNPEGKNYVSELRVVRTGYRPNAKDKGSMMAANYPWSITMRNFWADKREDAIGRLTYRPGSESTRPEFAPKQVSMLISDQDMYTACTRVQHFIQIWENAVCAQYVYNGVCDKELSRMQNQYEATQNTAVPPPAMNDVGAGTGFGEDDFR